MAQSSGDSGGSGSASLNTLKKAGSVPASWNGGTIAPPQQRAPTGPVYTPPAQQMVYTDPRLTNPNDNWAQPLPQSQIDSYNQSQAGASVPSGPVQGGREAYNQMDAGGRAAQDATWLAGDSDYTAQTAEYNKALQSFVDRIANQRKGFQEDADLATASTNRNQETNLNSLGEDFGARGLSYSGMFDTTKNETNQRFNDAKSGIERIRSKNDTDAVNRETDYRAENAISQSNASRASLGRQAQRQALIDSGGY